MKYRLWKSARCDELIGFLVAFENKANSLETCCEHPIEIIESNDSTSFSIHPAYIRHEHAARQAYRGRSRLPAQHGDIEKISKTNQTNKDISGNLSTNESSNCGLTVHARDEVVEVVFVAEGGKNTDTVIARESTLPAYSTENIEYAAAQLKSDDDTASSSSALSSDEDYMWKISNEGKREDKGNCSSSDFMMPLRNSQKYNELQVLQGQLTNRNQSGPCKFEKPQAQSNNHTICDLKPLQSKLIEKENKDATVAFRDPISELIPTERGQTSLHNPRLEIGDLVDIRNGRYTNKIGQVIKVSEDVVLVAIVGEFIKPLYVSPSMLRPANMSQIKIIY